MINFAVMSGKSVTETYFEPRGFSAIGAAALFLAAAATAPFAFKL